MYGLLLVLFQLSLLLESNWFAFMSVSFRHGGKRSSALCGKHSIVSRGFFKLWLATTFSASFNSYFTRGWSTRSTNTSVFISYLPLKDFSSYFLSGWHFKGAVHTTLSACQGWCHQTFVTEQLQIYSDFLLWLLSQVTLSATEIMCDI